jgi:hypothetical protein
MDEETALEKPPESVQAVSKLADEAPMSTQLFWILVWMVK